MGAPSNELCSRHFGYPLYGGTYWTCDTRCANVNVAPFLFLIPADLFYSSWGEFPFGKSTGSKIRGKADSEAQALKRHTMKTNWDTLIGRGGFDNGAWATTACLVLIGLLVARQAGLAASFGVLLWGLDCTCITTSCGYEGMEYMWLGGYIVGCFGIYLDLHPFLSVLIGLSLFSDPMPYTQPPESDS
jgi:hypothetical protein